MDIQQNNVAVLHFNLVNQDGSTIFIRKTKLATFNLINPSAVSVPITDIGFDETLNQCWVRVPKASNAATGQYYGVLNIVDDDWGTYTTSKIKVYSVVSDADEDTKSVVFTATCIATQVTNPSGGNSPYYNTTTSTWWQYSDTLKAFEDTGVGNLTQYITKNVQHLKDGTGNGSVVTCLDDEISANNIATGLCSTDFGKNNDNRGESCVALGENNYIAEGVSNATAIAGAQLRAVDVFAIGDKTSGHKNVFEIDKFGDIYFRPDLSRERTTILQDILDNVIKDVVYDFSNYSLTVTFYSAADNANKTKTYDLSGLKAVLKDDAVKEISVNQSTAVMTVTTINGSSQQIQLLDLALYQKKLTSGTNITITDDGVISVGTLTGNLIFSNSGLDTKGIYGTVGSLNDGWRLIGGATADDAGYLELATADDGTEPIYVRQYKYDSTSPGHPFTNIINTATLLDASGNTSFPGIVTASAFSGNASSATKAVQDGKGNVIADTYVLKKDGKGLSTNDYTNDEKTKLASIASGAEVNVQPNWSTTDTSADSYILNKPTALSSFTNDSGYDTVTSVNSKVASCLPLTGNAATATKLNTARTIGLSGVTSTAQSFDGSANITIPVTAVPATLLTGTASISTTGNAATATKATQDGSGKVITSTYLPLAGGTLTGDLLFFNSGLANRGIYGTVGTTDSWRLIGGASADNAGFLELATGDDATEPIYVRQYSFDAATGTIPYDYFGKIIRTATLLDASGNTSFPGTVTASAFSGNASSATKLNTARTIGLSGVTSTAQSFDGSANITIPVTAVPATLLTGTASISTTGNAATATSSNYIKSNTWNWSGVGSQGAEGTVRKIASITGMSYLEIDGGNMVGNINTKGIVKISMTYIDGLIISNNSTVSTNFGYVITSTTNGRNGKVNIDLYLQERSGENYYNILVSKFVGSSISFESPSAEVIPAPAGYVAIS